MFALNEGPARTAQTQETIRRALDIPLEERHACMQRMHKVVREHNVYRWAAELISELSEMLDQTAAIQARVQQTAIDSFRKSTQ